MEEPSQQNQNSQPAHSFWRLIFSTPIFLYRWAVRPVLGPSCRYYPSCSSYALQAIREHGVISGWWLTLKRLGRCHPFYRHSGYDPVPKSKPKFTNL